MRHEKRNALRIRDESCDSVMIYMGREDGIGGKQGIEDVLKTLTRHIR